MLSLWLLLWVKGRMQHTGETEGGRRWISLFSPTASAALDLGAASCFIIWLVLSSHSDTFRGNFWFSPRKCTRLSHNATWQGPLLRLHCRFYISLPLRSVVVTISLSLWNIISTSWISWAQQQKPSLSLCLAVLFPWVFGGNIQVKTRKFWWNCERSGDNLLIGSIKLWTNNEGRLNIPL